MDEKFGRISNGYVVMEHSDSGAYLAVTLADYQRIQFLLEVYGSIKRVPEKEMVTVMPIKDVPANYIFELAGTEMRIPVRFLKMRIVATTPE